MPSTPANDQIGQQTIHELELSIAGIKRMLLVAAFVAGIGYLLLLFALTQEFSTVSSIFAANSMKMWLKLGGIGHILLGILIALLGIVRVLSLTPERLSLLLE